VADLGLNLEAHDGLLAVLSKAYGDLFSHNQTVRMG